MNIMKKLELRVRCIQDFLCELGMKLLCIYLVEIIIFFLYQVIVRPAKIIKDHLKDGKLLSSKSFFNIKDQQFVKERHSFEHHSQNRERRRSATPFYQKERCGSGTHILEESENMSGPLLSLFFFQ